MKHLLLLFMAIFCIAKANAQFAYGYVYDSHGNRTKRYWRFERNDQEEENINDTLPNVTQFEVKCLGKNKYQFTLENFDGGKLGDMIVYTPEGLEFKKITLSNHGEIVVDLTQHVGAGIYLFVIYYNDERYQYKLNVK